MMVKHTRKHGTVVYTPANGAERMAAVRAVVAAGQYATIDDTMADLHSASAIIAAYDALGPNSQAALADKPFAVMASIAFRLLAKYGP